MAKEQKCASSKVECSDDESDKTNLSRGCVFA